MDAQGFGEAEGSNIEWVGQLPFRLQEKEMILRQVKPKFLGFMLSRTFGAYIALAMFMIALIAISGILVLPAYIALGGAGILILMFVIVSIKPLVTYGKFLYWITNHRVIGKRGVIGYSVDSIPLENVTDVVINRSTIDRLLGLSSLIIVPMTTARTSGNSPDEQTQNPNFFPALSPDTAEELQKLLFDLKDSRKKELSAAAAPPVPTAVAGR
ncbi:MAG: PH domain-containing protein [Candidatus Micrarchaeota archaeon]|nr:PH domain-containing protein [Candidatus Micrarchaeota archaeon]